MRLIDADALYRLFEEVYRESDYSLKDAAWWFFGKLGDAQTITPPPNDPLTLEELREMDGEPVWVVGVSCINDFKGHWDICDWENGEVVTFPYCMESPDILDYGINWKAYSRKPED